MSELTDMLRARAAEALPPLEGELAIPGVRDVVEVARDRWGVPHIRARSVHDLYLAQGYVMASDRLFQIDFNLRLGAGTLADLLGEPALVLDRFARTVGWNRMGRRHAERWDELSIEIADAVSAGWHAWLETMPARPIEYELLQRDPELPSGTDAHAAVGAAIAFMAWSLSGNWDAELLRHEVAERLGWEAVTSLFPDTPADPGPVHPGKRHGDSAAGSQALELLRRAPRVPAGQGSNNWVVAGTRSETGAPLLANDPHIFAQVPSVWYEVHLSAPGIDVAGVAFPWAAGVVIGHNERIAWGATNVGGDVQDVYLERLNDEGDAALFDGAWEPVAVYREQIRVSGRAEPEVLEIRETRHGPLLDGYMVGMADFEVRPLRETYALRWAAEEGTIAPSVVHRLDTARDFDEFRAALAGWTCPGQNFVYADVDGNIGYQCTGRHPVRQVGNGTLPSPGSTADHEWDGWVPFEELPWALNPASGFIGTANARPHDDGYPWFLGRDFLPPFRARRIAQLLTELERHDMESFARMQRDRRSLPAQRTVPLLARVEPNDERQQRALALLREWDFDLSPDSAAAAIYQIWCVTLAEAILRPRLGEELYEHFYSRRQWSNEFQTQVLPGLLELPTAVWFGRDGAEARDEVLRGSLDAALDEITERLGDDMETWTWGALHRIRFVHQIGRAIPDLAELFTAGEAPHGGDEQTLNQGTFEPGAGTYDTVVVSSWRQILDPGDWDRSVGTHTVGQSGNPASPHWNDLFALWSTGHHHPMPFTREAVERDTAAMLRLLPGA